MGRTDGDRFGVQRRYLDNADRPTTLSPDTVAALHAAIGEPPAGAVGPLVIHPGERWPSTLVLQLEDGGERRVTAGMRVDVPLGYHRCADGRLVIVSPGVCALPDRRAWGWTAQLPALRSVHSWGMGDLADLAQLTALAKAQGAGFVLVNPLHAGGGSGPQAPQQPSPYFPASRRFFSPLYLAVEQVEGATQLPVVAELANAGRALNTDRRIDRAAVWRLKRLALRAIFDRVGGPATAGLAQWRAARGQAVEQFATWSLLRDRHGPDWRRWPTGARRPGPAAHRDLAADELAFVTWLQWQCEQQLRGAGAGVRVLQDLPIGVDPNGADAWAYQDVLADGITVGAPPDPFNRAGQDWGLPPFVPWKLRSADYEPFIQAVRATMAFAGGLRIDHVMGLYRLWWIPAGLSADRGGYVRYPAGDLLDIVALESVRAGAPVVGEDLGTVEPGVREQLAARHLLSYRLLWFEADAPSRWPTMSLAAVGTHDLPTVAGLWDGSDITDQRRHGVDADEQATQRLRALLVNRAGVPADASPDAAVAGAYRLLAQSPSLLLAAAVDDALAEPVRPNIPGTTARANWSIALPVPLDQLNDQPTTRALAEMLTAAVNTPEQAPVGEPASEPSAGTG